MADHVPAGEAIILVTGGREYPHGARVFRALDILQPKLVVQGGARGADAHARAWASLRVVPCVTMDAPWEGAGRKAGPIRNAWMAEIMKPDVVLAFPGWSGTASMRRIAEERGIPVWEGEQYG